MKDKEKRQYIVSLTDDEAKQIRSAASKNNMTFSEFIRNTIVERLQ